MDVVIYTSDSAVTEAAIWDALEKAGYVVNDVTVHLRTDES